MGGRFHPKLNTGGRPIANKYREGKVKRTLERELKALEIVEREANGIGYGRREIISPGFRCPRARGRKLLVSGSELRGGCTRPVDRPTSARFTVGRKSEGGWGFPSTRSFGTVRRVEETNVRPRAVCPHLPSGEVGDQAR